MKLEAIIKVLESYNFKDVKYAEVGFSPIDVITHNNGIIRIVKLNKVICIKEKYEVLFKVPEHKYPVAEFVIKDKSEYFDHIKDVYDNLQEFLEGSYYKYL